MAAGWEWPLNLLHSERPQTSDGRHQQRCGRLIEQFARCQTHQTENKFLVTDYLIRRCQLRGAQRLGNQVDNHRIEHAENNHTATEANAEVAA